MVSASKSVQKMLPVPHGDDAPPPLPRTALPPLGIVTAPALPPAATPPLGAPPCEPSPATPVPAVLAEVPAFAVTPAAPGLPPEDESLPAGLQARAKARQSVGQ